MVGLSVIEAHIYVKQGLQRMGAERNDFQFKQAIDLALTRAQNRIIKARLKNNPEVPFKFEIDAKYTADIQPLIEANIPIKVYKDQGNRFYAPIPFDFGYLLNDRSSIIEDCKVEFATALTNENQSLYLLPFPDDNTITGANLYTTITVGLKGVIKALNTIGVVSIEEKIYMVDKVVAAFYALQPTLSYEVYWENYNDITYPGNIIIISNDPQLVPTIQVGTQSTQTSTQTNSTITTVKPLSGKEIQSVNRDTKQDFIYSALTSNYFNPTPESPLSTLASNRFWIYTTERFLVNKIYVDYIRKPLRVSLDLNQGLQVGVGAHEEVCELAVQLIKKNIQDNSLETELIDNRGRIE